MKLYKGDRVMLMVDKDQLDICLDAGWSRTYTAVEEAQDDVDVNDVDLGDTDQDEAEEVPGPKPAKEKAPKKSTAKKVKIKASKNK